MRPLRPKPSQCSSTWGTVTVTLPSRSLESGQSSSYRRHLRVKPVEGMLATIHSSSQQGSVVLRMVRVRWVSRGSSLCRLGTSATRVEWTKGSADWDLTSAMGRFHALWRVNLTVYPGGASGSGVGSKPPGGLDLLFIFSFLLASFCFSMSKRLCMSLGRRGSGCAASLGPDGASAAMGGEGDRRGLTGRARDSGGMR